MKPIIIGAKQVVEDLKSGLTRRKREDLGFGSIEEKYNLNPAQLKVVLQDSRIKNIKTSIPSVIVVDDINDTESYKQFIQINGSELQEAEESSEVEVASENTIEFPDQSQVEEQNNVTVSATQLAEVDDEICF